MELPVAALPMLPVAQTPWPEDVPSCSHHTHLLPSDAHFWDLFLEEEAAPFGRGSFGTVLRVRRTKKGAPSTLAAKVAMHDTSSAVALQRRYREADLLHALSHPNIVRHHSTYSSPSTLFVLMHAELGGDLMARCEAAGGSLPEPEARAYLVGIASALRHLHGRRIVHRDLKPSNVLLETPPDPAASEHGCFPRAKLADFGLAARLPADGRLTTVCGTQSCLAPEVIRCGHGDEPSGGYGSAVDLWSLGLLLHQLLLGQHPFERETDIATLQATLAGDYDLARARARALALCQGTRRLDAVESCVSPRPPPPVAEDARVLRVGAATVSEEAAALICSLLVTRPEARPTAADVLRQSPWVRRRSGGRLVAASCAVETRAKRKGAPAAKRGGRHDAGSRVGLLERLVGARFRFQPTARREQPQHDTTRAEQLCVELDVVEPPRDVTGQSG